MRHFGSHDGPGRRPPSPRPLRRHGLAAGRHHGGGMGGDDMMRAGRMLAQGDLRLLALALIAEQPRHGYEIIKVLEEKTAGWYGPSPGIVYPTLTYLEEAGYVTAQAEGTKKLYTITGEGRAYLEANRDLVDAVLERLAALGDASPACAARRDTSAETAAGVPPLVEAAFDTCARPHASCFEPRRGRQSAHHRDHRPHDRRKLLQGLTIAGEARASRQRFSAGLLALSLTRGGLRRRLRRVNMLGPDADAEQARRDAAAEPERS